GVVGPTGVDEYATALLTFASGFTAEVTSAVHYELGTTAIVFGETGKLVMPNPWLPSGDRHGLESSFTLHRDGMAPEGRKVRTEKATYAIEAELVANLLPATEAPWPAMSWADTLGNMRVLDDWRAAIED
ncbi:MAG TPA: hypothetical protein VJT73_10640, partial [Polyangiaceae bacterium]|nr:hypothetical protein [Polyangiaceae bacterium]